MVIASPEVSPRSTNSTKSGQAIDSIFNCGAAANASRYAFESIVARVPMTPTLPDRVAATARRTAGWITSITGIEYLSRASRSIAALAVLQAITSALTPCSTRKSKVSSEKSRTSASGLGP